MASNTSNGRPVVLRTALAVGFTALAGAILLADAHGATGYELSIYGGTPVGVWAGIGIALAISLLVAVVTRPSVTRTVALGLGGMAVTAIVGLPVLRGYYFHGTADALSHLGWTREIANGVLAPADLFYPGVHTVATLISSMTGIRLEGALMLTVSTMAVVALVFVPLAVRTITRDDRAVVVAAFATFMLFFVNNLGVYLHTHVFAQTVFFSALVFYLVFRYLTTGSTLVGGALLAIASLAVVLYHPQQAGNLVLVFVAISLVQLVHRRYRSDHPVTAHRRLYAHTGLLIAAFAVWVTQFDGWAFTNIGRVQEALVAYIEGRPPVPGGSFQSQAGSLAAVGSGLPEIFVKMFLVAAIFSVLAGALMAASMLGRVNPSRPDENAVALYLGVASVLTIPVIVAYFAGNIAEHYFRHLGFLVLIATIVGALALTRLVARASARYDPRWSTVGLVVVLALLLPLSLATVYPSPFIYKQTQHVTEPQMDGHATVFDLNDESLTLAGIRDGPWRFSEAIAGVSEGHRYEAEVRNENLTRLSSHFGEGGYLIVTAYDRQREVGAYRELRYTQRALDSLDSQRGVNVVVTNEEVRLYHVPEAGG